MITTTNPNDLIGADVYGDDEKKVGTVGQVYVDQDQSPTWITIRTGLFGTKETFAPLSSASFDDGSVRVPFSKDFIKDAPNIDADGALSETEEDSLYSYYGAGMGTGITDTSDSSRTTDTSPTGAGYDSSAGYDASAGHDTSGPNTDSAMTRSEERLNVGTERVETGRARLRKHVVTEQVSQTVPVSHEEVTITREPITDANIGDATSGPDLSEEEHEVVLTGERVVTDKETVPVERVALGTETVTEQQRVADSVSREEIEVVDADVDRDTGRDTGRDTDLGTDRGTDRRTL
ncbi:DUF2382 domain-containing protein [Naasia lichenicola]|uniref:DUF2382 domain-containing protein n=1 Tax=Naasia lichenicola TaxID=2565933 RepID=A0A4S4FI39_9MICO|nr:PRC and DUF2382 domain-containing protein [Naasia lichenicola]THG30003.1 DUF2382 domain-containing protein [Naasia lichenicola]